MGGETKLQAPNKGTSTMNILAELKKSTALGYLFPSISQHGSESAAVHPTPPKSSHEPTSLPSLIPIPKQQSPVNKIRKSDASDNSVALPSISSGGSPGGSSLSSDSNDSMTPKIKLATERVYSLEDHHEEMLKNLQFCRDYLDNIISNDEDDKAYTLIKSVFEELRDHCSKKTIRPPSMPSSPTREIDSFYDNYLAKINHYYKELNKIFQKFNPSIKPIGKMAIPQAQGPKSLVAAFLLTDFLKVLSRTYLFDAEDRNIDNFVSLDRERNCAADTWTALKRTVDNSVIAGKFLGPKNDENIPEGLKLLRNPPRIRHLIKKTDHRLESPYSKKCLQKCEEAMQDLIARCPGLAKSIVENYLQHRSEEKIKQMQYTLFCDSPQSFMLLQKHPDKRFFNHICEKISAQIETAEIEFDRELDQIGSRPSTAESHYPFSRPHSTFTLPQEDTRPTERTTCAEPLSYRRT